MKKIFLKIFAFMLLFFGVYSYSFSENTSTSKNSDGSTTTVTKTQYTTTTVTSREKKTENSSQNSSQNNNSGGNSITSSNYEINVRDIVPGGVFARGTTTEKRASGGLLTIIQRIMIPFGVLAVLIMTIGAGYMILHNGEDELLNKGKKIFKMGIFSISIALSSYIIVELVKYILYS